MRSRGDLSELAVIRIGTAPYDCHSGVGCAAANFNRRYGHCRLTAWCDNSGEVLAIIACLGNAGSRTAADHIAIIAQRSPASGEVARQLIDHHRWGERPWPPRRAALNLQKDCDQAARLPA